MTSIHFWIKSGISFEKLYFLRSAQMYNINMDKIRSYPKIATKFQISVMGNSILNILAQRPQGAKYILTRNFGDLASECEDW